MNKQVKDQCLHLRLTASQKEALKTKAAQSGLSVTEYLLKSSEQCVIPSPHLGRKMLTQLHQLHLQLLQLQQNNLSIEDAQQELFRITSKLRKQITPKRKEDETNDLNCN